MVSMNEREQLIEKLVTTMHLSVPERLALSPNNVRYTEVAAVVARVLENSGYFPPGARAELNRRVQVTATKSWSPTLTEKGGKRGRLSGSSTY